MPGLSPGSSRRFPWTGGGVVLTSFPSRCDRHHRFCTSTGPRREGSSKFLGSLVLGIQPWAKAEFLTAFLGRMLLLRTTPGYLGAVHLLCVASCQPPKWEKKSVREIKELDNGIGDVTKGLVCRGWFAERWGCPQRGSSPNVRGQPSPEHPSRPPAGTADLPFPGCGGAAGGSSLHQTPVVCFLLPSTSHIHDHHGEW